MSKINFTTLWFLKISYLKSAINCIYSGNPPSRHPCNADIYDNATGMTPTDLHTIRTPEMRPLDIAPTNSPC